MLWITKKFLTYSKWMTGEARSALTHIGHDSGLWALIKSSCLWDKLKKTKHRG